MSLVNEYRCLISNCPRSVARKNMQGHSKSPIDKIDSLTKSLTVLSTNLPEIFLVHAVRKETRTFVVIRGRWGW